MFSGATTLIQPCSQGGREPDPAQFLGLKDPVSASFQASSGRRNRELGGRLATATVLACDRPHARDRRCNRVAILNGFGRTLGDGVIGLQALSVALEQGAVPPSPVLFRLPGLPPVLRALYRAADFATARPLSWDHATREQDVPAARRFGRVIDLRDFAYDAGFLAASMIDFFLVSLGVDPASIAPVRRRNAWLVAG